MLKKDYRTLRFIAELLSLIGWVILIVCLFAITPVMMKILDNGLLAFLTASFFGVILGIPFVYAGQITSVFLDQKEFLEMIYDNVKNPDYKKIQKPSEKGSI